MQSHDVPPCEAVSKKRHLARGRHLRAMGPPQCGGKLGPRLPSFRLAISFNASTPPLVDLDGAIELNPARVSPDWRLLKAVRKWQSERNPARILKTSTLAEEATSFFLGPDAIVYLLYIAAGSNSGRAVSPHHDTKDCTTHAVGAACDLGHCKQQLQTAGRALAATVQAAKVLLCT